MEVLGRCVGSSAVSVDPGLLDVLKTVPDPRDPRGVRYPLWGLLAIAILATAAGMRSFAGITTWARTAPEELLEQLGIRLRRPSEKTLRTIVARLDAAELDRLLGAYFASIAVAAAGGGLVAVALDGKTVRGARAGGGRAPHLVSVFAHHAALVIGQIAVKAKTNEIPTVRRLLRILGRTRLLVTMDAMHTQVATAKLICGKLRSHYVMVAKANQPGVAARIKAQPWAQVPVAFVDGDDKPSHGRIETRTLKILTATRGIGFPYALQLVEIVRERVVISTGVRSVETVYAICSAPFEEAGPRQLAQWLRGHWGIENRVHYVRDVTYDEDRSTIRTDTAPQTMAGLRNTAINLHRLDGAVNIAEACRTTAFSENRGFHLLSKHQISRSKAH
jgi:predicted transposase YbfD/YdcC